MSVDTASLEQQEAVQTLQEAAQKETATVTDESQVTETPDEDNLPKFDSYEDLEDYTKILLSKKRKGFNEAKTYREQLQEANSKLGELEDKMTEQEKALASDYQKQIEELVRRQEEQSQILADYQQEVQRQQVLQAELQFKHAAEKNGIKEQDFLKYKWHQHLKSNPEGEAPDLDGFITQMKEKHPAVFTTMEAPQTPANSGLSMPNVTPATVQSDSLRGTISRTPAERMAVQNEWEAYKKANGLV